MNVREGIAIMEKEDVDVSISGNGTNLVRFTHLVVGAYKRNCMLKGKNFFACASGGGIGRTLGPDETSAGPASYGLTDSMSRNVRGHDVCGIFFGSRARGNDGLHRHGQ
jgi:hypothetical protein